MLQMEMKLCEPCITFVIDPAVQILDAIDGES